MLQSMTPSEVLLVGLALKIALTATVVVAASLVVERSGPLLGGMMAALPTSGGAALVILGWQHTPDFVSGSAVGAVVANSAAATFATTFAIVGQRRSLVTSLLVAYVAWFAFVSCARLHEWHVGDAIALNLAVFLVAIPLARSRQVKIQGARYRSGPLDLASRAAVAAAMVVVVTTASGSLGPFLSGVFSFFPIALSSFLIIVHLRMGPKAAASVAAHFPEPLVGLSLALVEVHYLATVIGTWWSYLLAAAICVAWSALLWIARAAFGRLAVRASLADGTGA